MVARAADTVADSPGFSAALRPAAVAAQRQLVEEPGEPVELDLGALRGPLALVAALLAAAVALSALSALRGGEGPRIRLQGG